jgi:hypothetical protein
MDSFLQNHQATLDWQRELQAIRDRGDDEDDKYFNHDLYLRIGTFEGKTEFKECVTEIEMFREVESKRFRKFKTIRLNKIPQIYKKIE